MSDSAPGSRSLFLFGSNIFRGDVKITIAGARTSRHDLSAQKHLVEIELATSHSKSLEASHIPSNEAVTSLVDESIANEQFTTQCKRHDSSSQKKVEKYAVWELFGGISHM